MTPWKAVDLDGTHRIRPATADDVVAVAGVHAAAWGRDQPSPEDLARATDLLTRPHPTFEMGDMTVVEELPSRRLVSAQHFSTHRWTYGGTGFDVGEIEHVSTVPDARRGGLVRAQTELMHSWATDRGIVATVINGIPWLYTRFGYELVLDKWWGPSTSAEVVAAASPVDVMMRPATSPADFDVVARAYAHGSAELVVGYERTVEHWRYEHMRSAANPWRRTVLIAEAAGEPIGFALAAPEGRSRSRRVDALELLPGIDWPTYGPGVLNALMLTADDAEQIDELNLGWLGRGHPAQKACPDLLTLAPNTRRGAWYVRIPDTVTFLRAMVPVLERRLSDSGLAVHRGTLRIQQWDRPSLAIDYDRSAVHVRPWQPDSMFDGDLRIANGLLAQIVLGHRSIAELEESHTYRIVATPAGRLAMAALFPTGRSNILPVY